MDDYKARSILLAVNKGQEYSTIQSILKQNKYSVFSVHTIQKAEEILGKHSDIVCILLDIDLGGKSQGIPAAKNILKKYDCPLIILSSCSDRETINKIEETTLYGFIDRNPVETALISSIHQACKLFESQQNLKKYTLRNSAIIKALSDMVFVIDVHGLIKEVYTSDESLLVLPADEIIGKTLYDVFEKKEAQRHLKIYRECLKTGKVHTIEYTLDLQGQLKHFEAQLSRLTDDTLISIVRDVTESKQLMESVYFEQQKLFSIFGSINEIMYIADPCTYEILYANEYTKKLFRKDLVGEICYRVLQHKDSPCEFCTNNIILKNKGKPYQWEYYNPVVKRDYLITDKIIQWIDGRDVRFELAIDITETKRAKDKVKHLNSLLMSIRNVNQLIVQENDLSAIIKGACKILLETRHYLNIEIALLDNKDEVIKPVANAGEHGIREWKIPCEEHSPAPKCIKEVVKTIQPKIITDPESYCSGCSYYDRETAHKTILIPMIQGETLAGILTVCMTPGYRISRDEIDLLKEVSGDLIFAKEKYEADQLLRESEARYRAIFYNAYDGIILQDASGRMLHWNKAAERVFGITEENASRHSSNDYQWNTIREDGSEFPGSEHPSMRTLATGQPYRNITMGIKNKSGKTSWVNLNTTPLFKDDDSKPYAVVITFSDITKIKELEIERKKLLNEYEAVFNGTQDALFLIKVLDNNQFVFIRNNRAHQEQTGISLEALLNNSPQQLFGKEMGDILQNNYKRCVQSKRPLSYEVTLDLPRGKRDWWSTITPVINGGKVEYIVGASRDITERKKAEKALKEGKEQLDIFFSQSLDGFFFMMLDEPVDWHNATDREKTLDYIMHHQRMTKVNQALLDQYKAKEKDFIGVTPSDLFKHNPEHGRNIFRKLFDKGHWHVITDERRFDGSQMWIDGDYICMYDEQGRITGHFGIQTDITERKKTEEALKNSEAFLSAVLESIQDGISVLNTDLTIRFTNQIMEKWYSHNIPVEGKKCYQVYQNKNQPCKNCPARRAISSGQVESDIVPGPPHEGASVVWLELFCYPLKDPVSSEVMGVVEFVRDITARKQAELALRESERKYAAVLSNMPGIAYRCRNDRNWTMIFVSKGSLELTGYHPDELIDNKVKAFNDIIVPEYREYLWKEWQTALTRREKFTGEYQIVTKEGHKKWVWEQGQGIYSENGEVIALEGFITDITNRKRAEKERQELQVQLNQSQKLESVGRLAGGIAHDFNNILGVILGQTEITMKKIGKDGGLYKDLKQIQRAAERSTELIQQMLAFARKQIITPRTLNLNSTIERMLKMLERLIGEDIHISWKPGTDLWSVKIDPSQIDQILVNLCVNSRDAIEGVGQITIETANILLNKESRKINPLYSPGEYVLITVSDTGCGIDEKMKEFIFEPFYTTKKTGEGTGLGLATVYGIVNQNQGFIDVASQPGKGTAFTIYLPRYQGKETVPASTVSETELRQGEENILVVEDEPAILEVCKTMLEDLGYHVLTASSPEEAIRLVESHDEEIHLLITDVVMPGMNGLDLAKKILPLYSEMKCLFMSGYTANVIESQSKLAQDIHFLKKPFLMKDLATKVREALEGK